MSKALKAEITLLRAELERKVEVREIIRRSFIEVHSAEMCRLKQQVELLQAELERMSAIHQAIRDVVNGEVKP